MADLAIERLHRALSYNPETGVFVRKEPTRGRRGQVGQRAGSLSKDGYRYVRVDTTRYLEHRLAWFYLYGVWPDELDHANRVRDDNRICNLRVATRSQNMANAPRQKNNRSGFKGVHFDKATGRWLAYMQVNKRFVNLGRFDSIGQARTARSEAHRKAFGNFARE